MYEYKTVMLCIAFINKHECKQTSLHIKTCAGELGILKDWVTNKDMLFSSSSVATTFILGYAFNDPKNWKNSKSIIVRELSIEN